MKTLKKVLCTILTGVLLISTLLFGAACQNPFRGDLTAEQMQKIGFFAPLEEVSDKNDLIAVIDAVNIDGLKTETQIIIGLIVSPIPPDSSGHHTPQELSKHNQKEIKIILDELKFDKYFKDYYVLNLTPSILINFYRPITIFDLKKIYKIAKANSISGVAFDNLNRKVISY